ncbi:hypothetical protein AMTRI_Chr10g8120 [Amborella trichopoda]
MAQVVVAFLLERLNDFIALEQRGGQNHCLKFAKKLIVHHKFVTEIQSIRRRVQEISDGRSTYQLEAEREEGIHVSLFLPWRKMVSRRSTSRVWNLINSALPENEKQSRIIISTRDSRVAAMVDIEQHTHFVEPQKETYAFDLFYLAKSLVSRCDGLPLAIVVMGGIMSRKPFTHIEWRRILEDSEWEVREGGGKVSRVLLLSYSDLPVHLKSCFLYCCLFPEDYEIKKNGLLRLWVAEGFVDNRPGKFTLDVADEYFKELIDRSMLLVVGDQAEHISSCGVHDVVREFAIPIAKEEISGEFYGGVGEFVPSKGRDIGIYEFAVLCFSFSEEETLSYMEPLTYNSRKLRVLHLAVFRNRPRTIELIELRDVSVHLRHIGIQKSEEVINVEIKLPEKLPKLQELQHANVICPIGGIIVQPNAIRSLQNLRTLGLITLNMSFWLRNSFT